MLEKTSNNFREKFLLKFTAAILENTESYRSSIVKEEVLEFLKKEDIEKNKFENENKKREDRIRELVLKKIREESKKMSNMQKADLSLELESLSDPLRQRRDFLFKKAKAHHMNVPRPITPESFFHLNPQPTDEKIDLGRLNSLIEDPLVKIIECNGVGENIIVVGIMGKKKTPLILSHEEILHIIHSFSENARIPIHEGLFKAAFGSSIISAVISETVGIKFIIRKISQGF